MAAGAQAASSRSSGPAARRRRSGGRAARSRSCPGGSAGCPPGSANFSSRDRAEERRRLLEGGDALSSLAPGSRVAGRGRRSRRAPAPSGRAGVRRASAPGRAPACSASTECRAAAPRCAPPGRSARLTFRQRDAHQDGGVRMHARGAVARPSSLPSREEERIAGVRARNGAARRAGDTVPVAREWHVRQVRPLPPKVSRSKSRFPEVFARSGSALADKRGANTSTGPRMKHAVRQNGSTTGKQDVPAIYGSLTAARWKGVSKLRWADVQLGLSARVECRRCKRLERRSSRFEMVACEQ